MQNTSPLKALAGERAVASLLGHSRLEALWSCAIKQVGQLRLAMNTHLPVVRPLLCYACRGATPMHQRNR